MATRPAKDAIANGLRKFLPERLAYRITRAKNIFLQDLMFKRVKASPQKAKDFLQKQLKKHLGEHYDAAAFTPPYAPWEQRLCLVPDADFFEAIKARKASIVTDHVERFDETGIMLKSGKHLDADVIVTATGLKIAVAGKIAIAVDGVAIDLAQSFNYRNCMYSNLPNFAAMFGYFNASWTLRVDIVADYLVRVLQKLEAEGAQIAVPVLAEDARPPVDEKLDLASGYLDRGKHLMPRNAAALPWRLNHDYRHDRKDMARAPLDDGILEFRRVRVSVNA